MIQTSKLEELLDSLVTWRGPLSEDSRARLLAAIRQPSVETWDEAHTLIIQGWTTLWQAVRQVDSKCPTSCPLDDSTAEERWRGYHPDSFTLISALRGLA